MGLYDVSVQPQVQIDDIANIIFQKINAANFDDAGDAATAIYNEGYRKQVVGHWFILEYEYFTCSECGSYHRNGCDSAKEAKERLANGEYPNFCFNCGSKMKGAEDEKEW